MPLGRNAKSARSRNRVATSAAAFIRSRFSNVFPLPRFTITSRQLIFASVALLSLAAVFASLNLQKTHGLRAEVAQGETARLTAEQQRVSGEKLLREREVAVAAANAKFGDSQNKIASSEAELAKVQAQKNDLQAKVQAHETEIAELRQRIDSAETKPATANSVASSLVELQAQLEDAKKQLDAAEREKILLSDKMKMQEKSSQLETDPKHRPAPGANNPGIRGTVLAVNQAYNFVVLSLGARQGVEANSEMLVLRSGSFIGKIRISSVEPATAIGDIITSTLARGVQVQPGDTVVYAGNNS
jgi:predicted RecA/RadA family phage recombinase